mgnify:CR=1 FL=1
MSHPSSNAVSAPLAPPDLSRRPEIARYLPILLIAFKLDSGVSRLPIPAYLIISLTWFAKPPVVDRLSVVVDLMFVKHIDAVMCSIRSGFRLNHLLQGVVPTTDHELVVGIYGVWDRVIYPSWFTQHVSAQAGA